MSETAPSEIPPALDAMIAVFLRGQRVARDRMANNQIRGALDRLDESYRSSQGRRQFQFAVMATLIRECGDGQLRDACWLRLECSNLDRPWSLMLARAERVRFINAGMDHHARATARELGGALEGPALGLERDAAL